MDSPSHKPIDICSVCHYSRYVDEMSAEYTPDSTGLSPTGSFLTLTCRECDDGRSETKVQLPPPVREQRNTHSGGAFRLIRGGKS